MSQLYTNKNLTPTMKFRHVTGPYKMARRLFDILVALLGFTLLSILIPAIWLANYLFSPGPLFYMQRRTGLHGNDFSIIKFRTMRIDAEADVGPMWAKRNDSRITVVGRVLRKTHMDELPQLWNLLKGDMSLIGPRPERPVFVEQLRDEIPGYADRHCIKPGITGLAQVRYPYGASVKDAAAKLEYDLFYLQKQNWRLDLKILGLTVVHMCKMQGR